MSQHLKHKKFVLPAVIIGMSSAILVSIMLIPITSEKTLNEFVIEKSSFQPDTTLGGTITVEGKYLTMIIQSSPADVPLHISLKSNDGNYSWEKEIRGDQVININDIKDRFLDLKIQNNAEVSVVFKAVIRDGSLLAIDQIEETEAISLIKKQYPQLQDFPSDKLPSKIIRVEKSNDGWYVIFETLGSGYPTLEAECFLVDNSNTVTQIGHYKHTVGMETNISFKTCS